MPRREVRLQSSRLKKRVKMQITDKAVLVKLSVSMPGNTRKDKKMTDEVMLQHMLKSDARKVLKLLFPKAAFEPIEKLAGAARNWHYAQTLPWLDEGVRILPTANHFAYCAAMKKTRSDFDQLVADHFLNRIDHWMAAAREMHNGTFDESQYSSADSMRNRFSFTTEFSPVPSSNDFRVSLSAEEMAAMSGDLDARVEAAVRAAEIELWQRLIKPVAHMAETLKDEKACFHDSLVGNIQAIVDLIPSLNVTGDANLAKLADDCRALMLNPDDLRKNKQARSSAADKAAEILARMQSYQ